jgi:hypothetical protein
MSRNELRVLGVLPLALALSWNLRAQDPLDQLATLVRARSAVPTPPSLDGALDPANRFRGKTLVEWLLQLTDADEPTAESARAAFFAMGSRAVPFLLRAQTAKVEWQKIDARNSPLGLCRRMGLPAVDALVAMLRSDCTLHAWVALSGIVDDSSRFVGQVPTPERRKAMEASLGSIVKALEPCLGSDDAAARFAAIELLSHVALTGLSDKALLGAARGARRLLENDPQNEVRGAACHLLVLLGIRQIEGGLSLKDLEAMVYPTGKSDEWDKTLPTAVARAAAGGILLHRMQASRERQPASPSGR